MKRKIKLALAIIVVLVTAVSVMAVNAGAADVPNVSYLGVTLSNGGTINVTGNTDETSISLPSLFSYDSNSVTLSYDVINNIGSVNANTGKYTYSYSGIGRVEVTFTDSTDANSYLVITLYITPPDITPTKSENTITVGKTDTYKFTTSELIKYYLNGTTFYSSNSTTNNYYIKVTSTPTKVYGTFKYDGSALAKNNGITGSAISKSSTSLLNYQATTYSVNNYDTIVYDIYYNNILICSDLSLNVKVSNSSTVVSTAQDFSIGYDSSDTSVTFSKKDFTNHFDSDADIEYVVFTDLPSSKYGILYKGKESSSYKVLEDDTEIDYDDLSKLLFVFGSSFTDGSAKLEYYIVDDEDGVSNTATITITNALQLPVAYDYAVAVESKDTYEFDGDEFDAAYYSPDGEDLSSILITALPEDGTLYLGSKEVSVGDTISYNKLGNLEYKAVKGDYRDSFSWQAYDGENYSAASAKMQFLVFSDGIVSAGGDMTVYLDDDDEATFSLDAFERVYVTDEDDNYLDSIKITSLPSEGTLYVGEEKSSNKVTKNKEISYDELDDLLYVADSGFSDEDSFEYLVMGEDDEDYCDKDYVGTVTIKRSVGGYTYSVSGTTMTLTFTEQVPSSNAVTGELTESDITTLLAAAKTGTTLVVYIPATTSVLTRTLIVDDSLFTVDNVKKISTIQLIDGEPDGKDPVIITLDTAAISSQYSRSTSEFSVTSTAVSPSTALTQSYNAGKMRTVTLKIGSTAITGFSKVGSAKISFPCATTASQTQMAVVLNAASANSTYVTPLVSSSFDQTGGVLTADFSAIGSGTYLAGVNVKSFSDMGVSNWDYEYVINLASRNVIDGYPEGTYLNQKQIKRSEYIKLLVECFGLNVSGATCQFTDVTSSAWYYSYLASAVKSGVLSDGTAFYPDDYITRDDMALYSYRAALAAGIDLATSYSSSNFTDQASIGSTYTTAIQALQSAGILEGYTDGSFKPKNTTKRGEAAKVICLLLDQYYNN